MFNLGIAVKTLKLFHHLNTSHVNVQLAYKLFNCIFICYLNTSHVNVQYTLANKYGHTLKFKYISC